MSRIKETGPWGPYERAVMLLLAACVTLLAAQAALIWFYGVTRDNSAVTPNQADTATVLLAVKEQQAASNMRLETMMGELHSDMSAIRDELHALNAKASVAAGVTPPQSPQR